MHGPHSPDIQAIFAGGPKTLHDERGPWRSSIEKHPLHGPVEVTLTGIPGDKATRHFHGGPDAALCVHLADHYTFWRDRYSIDLQPGAIGENLTVANLTEDNVSVGDTVRLGTVLVQVTGPRVPCANQARHLHRNDWVKLTLRENRTGFYLRILEPGVMQAGDPWQLTHRLNEDAAIPTINRCMYRAFDPAYARRMTHMPALTEWWKQQAKERLAADEEHWTSTLFPQHGAE